MLKNVKHANSKMVTSFGTLVFDEEGNVTEPKLTEEAIKALSEIKGFEIVGGKKEAPKKETAKKEEKNEEVKKEDDSEPKEEGSDKPKAKSGIKRPSTKKTVK